MSLSFDGVDDQWPSGTEIWGNIFSVAMWINPTTLGEGGNGFLIAHGTSTSPRFLMSLNNVTNVNSFVFRVGRGTDGVWRTAPDTVVLGVWQHLVVTYDGSVATNHILAYYNGQPFALTTVTAPAGTFAPDNQVVYVGNNYGVTKTFKGMIAEVAVWPYILSPDAVQNVYTRGVLVEPNIQLYWPGDYKTSANAGKQQFWSGGPSMTLVGVLSADHPVRPAGR
jgi:hypothetical protein